MRIWTFGCSFTSYNWPTWADIVLTHGRASGINGYNLGRQGAGNLYIACKIWECNAKYKFNSDDWVFICWSGFNREDRYTATKHWVTPGNIGSQTIFDKSFINEWADEQYYAMRDCMLITATINGMKNLGVNVLHWTMNPYDKLLDMHVDTSPANSIQYILDAYDLNFDFTNMMEYLNILSKSKDSRPLLQVAGISEPLIDYHPTVEEHMEFVEGNLVGHQSLPWLKTIHNDARVFVKYWKDHVDHLSTPAINTDDICWRHTFTKGTW